MRPGPGFRVLPRAWLDTRGPVRAHSPSALLGQVGRLEEAAGATVLRAGVHGQAWSEVLSGPCWDGPAGGDGTAGPHGPSAASSLSSPPLENPVSPGPGSGEAEEQMVCLGGVSEQGSWPPWLGPDTQAQGRRIVGLGRGACRGHAGLGQGPRAVPVLAPGCPALGPEGSRNLLPSAPERNFLPRGWQASRP